MSELPPAGWYPDPDVPGQQRYWDGVRWSEHTAPVAPPTSPQWPDAASRQPTHAAPGLGAAAPDPWLWQSIVTTVTCCCTAGLPGLIGIVAIVFASNARGAIQRGDLDTAQRQARLARGWTIATLAIGLVLTVVLFALGVSSIVIDGVTGGLDAVP